MQRALVAMAYIVIFKVHSKMMPCSIDVLSVLFELVLPCPFHFVLLLGKTVGLFRLFVSLVGMTAGSYRLFVFLAVGTTAGSDRLFIFLVVVSRFFRKLFPGP